MSKHDQAALDAATQIIDLLSSPGQWRDTWHLKHKVQCLLIDLLERNATQPAAGEPVAIANRGKCAFWVRWTDAAEGLYGPGIKLYAAPPVAAHGDEAERKDAERWRYGAKHSFPDAMRQIHPVMGPVYWVRDWQQDGERFESAEAAIDAAMRAQGDGGGE